METLKTGLFILPNILYIHQVTFNLYLLLTHPEKTLLPSQLTLSNKILVFP